MQSLGLEPRMHEKTLCSSRYIGGRAGLGMMAVISMGVSRRHLLGTHIFVLPHCDAVGFRRKFDLHLRTSSSNITHIQ